MLKAYVGSRLPARYRSYLDLPGTEPSFSLTGAGDTPLGRATCAWLAAAAAENGVYRLDDGPDALGARLGLIRRAAASIDIQSYLIRDDLSGNLMALALLEAADRGVRVRLLMDDALTEAIDAGLMAINAHPRVEVRVFNPFPRRRSRLISFITNFNLLTRRMHNKSFTVDNRVTIVGGRNIADEYFVTGGLSEFVDEDLLAVGRVVGRVSEGFDAYWNRPEALPIDVIGPVADRIRLDRIYAVGHRYVDARKDDPFLSRVSERVASSLEEGTLPLVAADVEVVMDDPEKIRRLVRQRAGAPLEALLKIVSGAGREVVVVSPYFVPQQQGVDFFASLVRKGVRVVIATNSLATTNHASVHAVYARYRKPLLRQGVELYELAPGFRQQDAVEGVDPETRFTLHSKIAVVDRRTAFVGSFNLDPRSLYLNTEMGMIVRSQAFGEKLAAGTLESLKETSYELGLEEDGGLRWTFRARHGVRIARRDPDTTPGRRIAARLMGYLPIESQM